MVRFLIGWITIVAIFVSSVPWDLVPLEAAGDDSFAVAADLDAPLSCPGEDGPCDPCDPCDDGCLCPCCPTFVTAPEALGGPELQPPTGTQQPRFPHTRRLSPADVHFRVFHPPRLV